jgi:methylated-DNA-[protein]-cysteine S-methyltransferase
MLYRATQKTPVGELSLVSDEHILLAAGFRGFEDLFSRMEQPDQKREVRKIERIPIISDLISDYFAGDLSAFGGIKVRQPGTEFSQEIWKALRKVPAGKTWSYADLAERVGSPAAVRAAGSACGRNLIAPIIPCHRIVKTGGALGNYGYGLQIKEWLLRHERAL